MDNLASSLSTFLSRFSRSILISAVLRHGNFHDGHRVVAEDVHDLHRQLPPAGFALVEHACEFQRAILLRPKRLPLVLEDEVTRPDLFPLVCFVVFHADDFPLVLKVEVHRPVVDPVSPVLG